MTFRPDTSFPYLALARRAGVDYGELLRLGDELKNAQMGELQFLIENRPIVAALIRVMSAEKRRRATIIHNAMHTGDAP